MKPLKPSMRENKRYLLVRGKSKNLREDIGNAILEFVGVLGMSKAGLEFIGAKKNSVILSVNREAVDFVRASLCVWPEKIVIKKVSGTIKGLERK